MKLREIKTKTRHYFKDEQGKIQGKYKELHDSEQPSLICYFRDDKLHGEYKDWYRSGQQWELSHWKDGHRHGEFKYWATTGRLIAHTFKIDGEEIIDFIANPELYPSTPEEKTMFVLKYGCAPLIRESEDE